MVTDMFVSVQPMLQTAAVFSMLAGALSPFVPYFTGLSLALGALAAVAWAVMARARWAKGPRARRSVIRALFLVTPFASASGFMLFGAPLPWNRLQGPFFAAAVLLLWITNRRWGPSPRNTP